MSGSDTPEVVLQGQDGCVTVMSNDGAFRVLAARLTDTARAAADAQQVQGAEADRLAELLVCAALYRETMAPPLRVQAIVRGAGPGGYLVADSHPDGWSRGLVQRPKGHDVVDLRTGAQMQMMRALPNGNLHRGVVAMPDDGDLSRAFMGYMQASEQVVSMISVAAVRNGGDDLACAGGYIVQVLPEAAEAEAAFAVMTERLADFERVGPFLAAHDAHPDVLIGEILYGMPFTELHRRPLRYGCECSQVRVMTSLSTLSAADIAELMSSGEVLDLRCDFCGRSYMVDPETLRGLLEKS